MCRCSVGIRGSEGVASMRASSEVVCENLIPPCWQDQREESLGAESKEFTQHAALPWLALRSDVVWPRDGASHQPAQLWTLVHVTRHSQRK